jgi:hypothetical protein
MYGVGKLAVFEEKPPRLFPDISTSVSQYG